MSCGIAWGQVFQECFKYFTFHYSNCFILRVKTMLNNSETDRNKSAQHQVKSGHYKWLLLMPENLWKKSYQVRTRVRICLKDATPLRVNTLSRTSLVASRHIKREKSLLPVDVCRSKTFLFKPPIKAQGLYVAFMESVTHSLVSARLSEREALARIHL